MTAALWLLGIAMVGAAASAACLAVLLFRGARGVEVDVGPDAHRDEGA